MSAEIIGLLDWKCKKVMRAKVDAYVIAARISTNKRKFKRLLSDLNKCT